MDIISGGPSKGIQYDFSISDIERHFAKHKLTNFVKYILYTEDQQLRGTTEIKYRMNEIRKPEFMEDRIKNSNETKQYILTCIHKYLKGPDIVEKIDNISPIGLPSYIEAKDIEHIKGILETRQLLRNYRGMRGEVAALSGYDNKRADRKIAKLLYNAQQEYKRELIIANREYKDELEARDKENDSNDMYKRYDTLDLPENTAKRVIYDDFLVILDPERKYFKQNIKIFDTFCEVFEKKEEEYKLKIELEKDNLEKKKESARIEQQEGREILEQSLFSEQTEHKNLRENNNTPYEEVDDNGDVIGLTKYHTKGRTTSPDTPGIQDRFK